MIDSADFSPQHRLRLYWHNFPIEPHLLPSQREQDVQDILTPHCQRYSLVKKIRTVTTKVNSLKQGKRDSLIDNSFLILSLSLSLFLIHRQTCVETNFDEGRKRLLVDNRTGGNIRIPASLYGREEFIGDEATEINR